MKRAQITIVMGSDSDLEEMSEASQVLDEFAIENEQLVLSAHRTPEEAVEFAKNAKNLALRGFLHGMEKKSLINVNQR